MRCAICHQEIEQAHPEMCPYCFSRELVPSKSMAEQIAEEEKMEKLKPIGKIGSINMKCPHCGASQPLASKSNEVMCTRCHKSYVIPKKVLDLL